MIYNLVVFDRGVGYPEELPVLRTIFKGEQICAAQCGPINVCQFESDFSREEICDRLKSQDIEFILTEKDNSATNLPKKIQEHFDLTGKPDLMEAARRSLMDEMKVSVPKVSLQDQLKTAIDNEDYEAAAKIKEKMDKSKQQM